jgi:hypothetical protein
MRNILLISLMVLLVAAVAGVGQDHDYVGTDRCKMCHQRERGGMIYEKWSEGPHAQAFETLATEKAMEYSDNPQEDPECLKCHVTGGKMGIEKVDHTLGVTCEECHGPGGDYWKKSIMEDREKAIANGMVANPKEDCVDCHNEESPTFIGFELEEFYAKIKHEVPAE